MSDWESVPAYVQLLNDLRRQIESGRIEPGAAIPSVTALMEVYGVSSNTVQKAVRALKASGLVDAQPGKGVYVRAVKRRISRSADFVAPVPAGAPIPHGRSTEHETGRTVPPDDVAEKLGTEPSEQVAYRRRIMADADGTPTQIGVSYIPLPIARGTELERPARLRGAVPAALKRAGYPPRSSREWVTGRMPTADEARILRITAGIPVLRILRMTWSDGGRAVEALTIVLSGEIFELEYDLHITEEL